MEAIDIVSSPRRGQVVLIVDDELSIRRTLQSILEDEGLVPIVCQDGEEALRQLKKVNPDLVLLDIWLPGMDGLETLRKIKEYNAQLPVVMISGHATIATALSATRLGAFDFIEKPLDLESIISTLNRALNSQTLEKSQTEPLRSQDNQDELGLGRSYENLEAKPTLFVSENLRGKNIKQRTLQHSALLYGQGLHSGKKSGLILEPLPPFSGIHFMGVSDRTAIPAFVDYVDSTGFATTIKLGGVQAGTIEHLMSALHAYKITNLLIKCNGEVPVMDGSAKEFCALFEEIGLEEQEADWFEIAVDSSIKVEREGRFIQIDPADNFSIEYTLDYPAPVGRQVMRFELSDIEQYKSEIAPARTFGFVREIGTMQKQGLALGGRFDNFVLIGDAGAINDTLRFENEPVRHKILDVIGDLFLLGRPIRGKVTAHMTGHTDNIMLLRAIKERL